MKPTHMALGLATAMAFVLASMVGVSAGGTQDRKSTRLNSSHRL